MTLSSFGCSNVNTSAGSAIDAHLCSFTTYGVSMCARSPYALASFHSLAHVTGAR